MNALILAADAHTEAAPPGDEWATVAYVMLGILMLIAAITTIVITTKDAPGGHH